MKLFRFDSIRLNLILVVLLGALPVLAMILWSGAELRERELRDAKTDALRLVRSFGEQQQSVTRGVELLLSTLSLIHDQHHHLDHEACNELFKALVVRNPIHSNFTLLTPNGDVIASALPFSSANFADQKHVAQTMKTRRFAAGEYMVGRISTEPVIAFAYPVEDKRGELIGILTTSLKLSRFVELFDAAMLPQGTSLGLVDGKGTRLLFYPYKPETNPLGGQVSPQALHALLGPEEEGVAVYSTRDGVRRYMAFTQLRLDPKDPPYLVINIGVPESVILSKADQVTRKYLLWFSMVFGFSLGAAWMMGKYGIINPLKRFAGLAKRVGEGDLDAVSGMNGGSGTLNTVAAAFDGMVKALKSREAERRLAEDALRESGERFRHVVEGTDNLITQVDGAGRLLYVNPVARKVFGLEPEECIGRNAFEFVHEDDRETTERAFAGWLAAGLRHVVFENRVVSSSGEARRMSWTIDFHYGADGKATVIDGIAQDITLRKQAEDAINASLREKEVLLREIHHRVKNNLQIISSLLSLQEEGLTDKAALDALAASRSRVISMAMIHEQLYRAQDLSGIDADEYLRNFVPRLVTAYKGAQDITLVLDGTTPASLALDQAVSFGLIVNELVTNAIKHAFKGRDKGAITISTSLAQGMVTLVVADDGVGLPEDFEQLKTKTLGLQMVAMLTNQLRGKLAVETSPGTTFRLTFPCRTGFGA